jgi:hypothetical protein
MAGRGRPKLDLDENAIANYARLGCSMRDIGLLMQCSPNVIKERFKKVFDRARAERRASIRKMQWDSAKGAAGTKDTPAAPANVTMQIWLGKNELGQQDKHVIKNTGTVKHKHDAEKSLLAQLKGDAEATAALKTLSNRMPADVN